MRLGSLLGVVYALVAAKAGPPSPSRWRTRAFLSNFLYLSNFSAGVVECYRRLPPPVFSSLPSPSDLAMLNASLRTRLALTRGSQTSHMPKGRHRERFASSFQKNFATQRLSLLNLTCRLLTRTRLALTRGSELSRTRERDADGDAFFLERE